MQDARKVQPRHKLENLYPLFFGTADFSIASCTFCRKNSLFLGRSEVEPSRIQSSGKKSFRIRALFGNLIYKMSQPQNVIQDERISDQAGPNFLQKMQDGTENEKKVFPIIPGFRKRHHV